MPFGAVVLFYVAILEAALRFLGALLMEIDEKWASSKKDLDMFESLEGRAAQEAEASAKVVQVSEGPFPYQTIWNFLSYAHSNRGAILHRDLDLILN